MRVQYIIAVVGLSIMANSSLAKERDTKAEETNGVITGLVIGASIGGPFGAGVGAILGGGIIGKLVGTNRINRELEVELHDLEVSSRQDKDSLKATVADLSQDLNRMIEIQAGSWKEQELPIQFQTGSSEIEKHYGAQLKKISEVLSRNMDAKVSLSGFADRRGASEYNQNLSEKRVLEVRRYLLDHGVRDHQIFTSAHGESQPLKQLETFESNFFDRRVVLELTLDVDSQLADR